MKTCKQKADPCAMSASLSISPNRIPPPFFLPFIGCNVTKFFIVIFKRNYILYTRIYWTRRAHLKFIRNHVPQSLVIDNSKKYLNLNKTCIFNASFTTRPAFHVHLHPNTLSLRRNNYTLLWLVDVQNDQLQGSVHWNKTMIKKFK